MVHQHFMLVPTLTVTQNIILGAEPVRLGHIRYAEARKKVAELAERYHLGVYRCRVEDLSVGMQQRVEILKALYRSARILILDEPTGVLTGREVEELFGVLRRLASHGTSIIIITHKLDEVENLSAEGPHPAAGNRGGREKHGGCRSVRIGFPDGGKRSFTPLAARRPGAILAANPHRGQDRGPKLPRVSGSHGVQPGRRCRGDRRPGRWGRQWAERACRRGGGACAVERGTLVFKGNDISRWSVKKRMLAGMGTVPQDRRGAGLVLPLTIEENLLLGASDSPPVQQERVPGSFRRPQPR